MRSITRQDADEIVKKLGAEIRPGRKHNHAYVSYEGREVLWFAISFSPRKDKGHGHIPKQLHQTFEETKLLAQCPRLKEHWISDMIGRGIIEPDSPH